MRIAAEVGAARVELATALALGGLTPSPATLELALEAAGANGPEVHVLIRPRAGGFHYSADELAVVESAVRRAVPGRAAGGGARALYLLGRADRYAMARRSDEHTHGFLPPVSL